MFDENANNITDEVLQSTEDIIKQQTDLQNKIDENEARKRAIASEKRHKQRMLAEKGNTRCVWE